MTARWLAGLAVVLATTATAAAYPQFQRSSGTARCSACHFAPAGGGLLNSWGQDEYGDTLARGGDGKFLHGALDLPAWLALGGDLRVAALANDVGASDGTELAVFPMQADLSARVGSGAFSATVTIGARGAVRSGDPSSNTSAASEVGSPTLGSYVISREHYVMWRPEDTGVYVRAGRFAAPYGLRLADHTAYIRRFLGFNLMEETYGVGGGLVHEDWEVHATAFVSDPLQGAPRKEAGAAVMVEATPGDRLVIGSSARAAIGSATTRVQAGLHAKWWFEGAHVLFQAEADGVREQFDGGGARTQVAAYAGPVWIPTRGLYTGVAYQVFTEDVHVHGVTRQSGDAWVSFFPRAHVEVMASGRAQRIGPTEHAYLALLQVHYSL